MTKTEPIDIYITAKDIREAEPGKPSLCLVARSLRRAFIREYPEVATEVKQGEAELDITVIANPVVQVLRPGKHAELHWWRTSSACRDLIHNFDAGLLQYVKPGKFHLTPGAP